MVHSRKQANRQQLLQSRHNTGTIVAKRQPAISNACVTRARCVVRHVTGTYERSRVRPYELLAAEKKACAFYVATSRRRIFYALCFGLRQPRAGQDPQVASGCADDKDVARAVRITTTTSRGAGGAEQARARTYVLFFADRPLCMTTNARNINAVSDDASVCVPCSAQPGAARPGPACRSDRPASAFRSGRRACAGPGAACRGGRPA